MYVLHNVADGRHCYFFYYMMLSFVINIFKMCDVSISLHKKNANVLWYLCGGMPINFLFALTIIIANDNYCMLNLDHYYKR